jgi:hypothetical protein
MADRVIKELLSKNEGEYETYMRFQGETSLDFMSIKKKDLDGLIALGDKLW